MDWPIVIGVIVVVGVGGLVVAKWWFRIASRFHRYEDEPAPTDPRSAGGSAAAGSGDQVVIHWDAPDR